MQPTDIKLKNSLEAISKKWDDDIIPQLQNYIRIPNKSPMFDPEWKEHGFMDQAMQLIIDWCQQQGINNMTLQRLEEPGRTPLLFIEVKGDIDDTILLYGHMDKQPEMEGWDDDKGPWHPVILDGKLYGRGGADDGYAVFASLTAIKTLQDNNIPHSRCVIIIEGSEESASHDLPHYLKQLKAQIGNPSLVICLDSGCANYEQLWSTTSLRGVIEGVLKIDILHCGIHSGVGGGVVPPAFNILRQLLDRIQNHTTHEVLLEELKADIPQQRVEQAQLATEQLGEAIISGYPFVGDATAVTDDLTELTLNRTWRAAMAVVGSDGLPSSEKGGNVTIPRLSVKLSLRIPPTCDPDTAIAAVKKILEENPPHDAQISFTPGHGGAGWNAPALTPWLEAANEKASQLFYGKPAGYIGEGGSIPFMGMLGDMYPDAQFLIAGVLGPNSNAHGPNEFLHIDMGKRLTGCVASVIASHYDAFKK
ncbi:MAG: peptidase M20 [Coxiella sp. (in: Bacteria)]|nr:MAG: peptidase M20 [Coxiella sp. (in: g-proteobacteria)]